MFSTNIPTYHYSNAETGANTNETVLTTANVNPSSFGKIASMAVDGQIYGQPLVMTGIAMANGQGTHDIVLVTTENDSVYAFDAYGNNPAQGYLWRTSLLQTGESTVPATTYGAPSDITPQLGITGTPVINPATNTLYVVGLFHERNGAYTQRICALNIASGANAIAPVTITASVPGTGYDSVGGVINFDPFHENQRPALTLANGEVYVGWSSHQDESPYHGWVIAFNAATLLQDYAYCDTPNSGLGGIWMSGGGIAVDASGNLYFTTGNGTFDANNGGGDYGMTIEKLSPSLAVEDYFSPYNEAALSDGDLDYGCSNVILLPGQTGADPNQVLSAGKWGTIYLNNQASLGGFNGNGSGPNADLGEATLAGANVYSPSNVHNTMVYWNGSVYLGGDGLTLQAFAVANGSLGTKPSSQSTHIFGVPEGIDGQGAGLTVSSNGSSNGIVWALDNTGFLQSPAVLYAYNANNLGQAPLWTSGAISNGRDIAGIGVKFQDPVVANGHVYIAGDGTVTVYGLLATSTAVPTVTIAAAASPSIVTGTSTTLSVSASDTAGDLSPNYTWTATTIPAGATAPTFSINGTNNANSTIVTFNHAGAYTFTAMIEDPNSGLNVTTSVNVTISPTVAAIAVTHSNASIGNSGGQWFFATAVDQFGNQLKPQPALTWTVNAGGVGGTINSSGFYTAPANGSGTDAVTATAGSVSGSVGGSSTIVVAPPATNQINLSSIDNKVGIVSNGTTFSATGGIDGHGDAISGNLAGTSLTWNGSAFTIPAPSAGNTTGNVAAAAGQTITVSPFKYASLKLLAMHVNGNQASATPDAIIVTYVGGITQSFSQQYSNWSSPQNYAGESTALTMAYRDLHGGTQGTGPFYIYGYSFPLADWLPVQSIALPTDSNFIVVAMDLTGMTLTTPATANPASVTGNTTTLTALATVPAGDLAPVYTWSTTTIPAGAAVPTFSVNNGTSAGTTTVTFSKPGGYVFRVEIEDPTSGLFLSSSVTVTVQQAPLVRAAVTAPSNIGFAGVGQPVSGMDESDPRLHFRCNRSRYHRSPP